MRPKFVLVYTPGRVGTISLMKSLRVRGIYNMYMHDHRLDDTVDGIYRDPASKVAAKQRSEVLQQQEDPIHVVTAVRDPIERAISAYCYFHKHYRPPTNPDTLKHQFLTVYPHEWYLSWFTNQLGTLFKTDILSKVHQPEENFWRIRTEKMDLAILKLTYMEEGIAKLNDVWDTSLLVENGHRVLQKQSLESYEKLMEMKFPVEFTERIYSSRLCKLFYTKEEIQQMKERWTE